MTRRDEARGRDSGSPRPPRRRSGQSPCSTRPRRQTPANLRANEAVSLPLQETLHLIGRTLRRAGHRNHRGFRSMSLCVADGRLHGEPRGETIVHEHGRAAGQKIAQSRPRVEPDLSGDRHGSGRLDPLDLGLPEAEGDHAPIVENGLAVLVPWPRRRTPGPGARTAFGCEQWSTEHSGPRQWARRRRPRHMGSPRPRRDRGPGDGACGPGPGRPLDALGSASLTRPSRPTRPPRWGRTPTRPGEPPSPGRPAPDKAPAEPHGSRSSRTGLDPKPLECERPSR